MKKCEDQNCNFCISPDACRDTVLRCMASLLGAIAVFASVGIDVTALCVLLGASTSQAVRSGEDDLQRELLETLFFALE